MKKTILLLLVLFVCINFSVTSFAVDGGLLTADSVVGKAGDTVTVSVSISNNPGIIATKLSLDYDTEVMKLISVENGNVFKENTFVAGNDVSALPFNVLWEDSLSVENNKLNGKLVTFKFDLLSDANTGEYPITITYDTGSTFDTDLENVPFQVENGSVHIVSDADTSNSDNNDREIVYSIIGIVLFTALIITFIIKRKKAISL